MMNFPQFLEMKFLDWQQREGGRKTVAEFAKYLGVKQSTVSMWWTSNNTPRDDGIIRNLAFKLGVEVYDVLGLDRPDADLLYMQQHWDEISTEDRRAIRDRVAKYVEENEALKVRKNRRARANNG
jgi:transcriptional regulator with XRE-family HTH domain